MESYDVVVVGGGMAGVSIGYELAAERRVAVLDMEATLAFHTTGRSAAMFLESYGGLPIRALTTASREFLLDPPWRLDGPLLSPLAMLHTAAVGRGAAIEQLYRDVSPLVRDVQLVGPAEVQQLQPLLRPGRVERALLEPGAMEIDVHGLHQGLVHGLRRRGGVVALSAPLQLAARRGDGWELGDGSGRTWRAPVVVDAAGAWADRVAGLFGARPVGLMPLRRTAFIVDGPAGLDARAGPMIADIDDGFYVKPEGQQLLCSPADETRQEPGDAKADQLEIARALEVIGQVTTLDVTHVRSAWAGLRTFAPDRTPVVGYDPHVEGLFWFAGQGGYGIQTAPALARTAAALLDRAELPRDVAARGLTAAALAPDRSAIAQVGGAQVD